MAHDARYDHHRAARMELLADARADPHATVMAGVKRDTASQSGAVAITDNQREILLQLFAGMDVHEVAAATGRKPSTIFNTLRTVRKQLGARGDVDLMRECLRRHIFSLKTIVQRADELRRAQHPPAGRAPGA
jgi:DNA-binding CsgD family transcriptional regulator